MEKYWEMKKKWKNKEAMDTVFIPLNLMPEFAEIERKIKKASIPWEEMKSRLLQDPETTKEYETYPTDFEFLAEKHNQLCDEMRETKEKLNEVIAKVNKINKRSEENEQKN